MRLVDSDVDILIADYYKSSTAFIDSLPRHLLGSLSGDYEMMVAVNALISYRYTIGSRTHIEIRFRELSSAVCDEYANTHDGEKDMLLMNKRVVQEAEMWRVRMGLDLPLIPLREWGAFLSFILDNPRALAFAEIGMRDVDFIARCLSDDIDADLAIDLYSPTAA